MPTRTVNNGNDQGFVSPSAATGQFLEYNLKVSGARANFAFVDDNQTSILTHMDFGLVGNLVWQLKTSVGADGKINVAVPQNPGYSRTEGPGTRAEYLLSLAFVTAVEYALTINLCNADQSVATTLRDIKVTMQQPTDLDDEAMSVNLVSSNQAGV